MKRNLRYYREKAGLIQSELAHRIDVATITIRSIENCKRNPSIEMAKKICIELGVKLELVFPDIFLLSFDT